MPIDSYEVSSQMAAITTAPSPFSGARLGNRGSKLHKLNVNFQGDEY